MNHPSAFQKMECTQAVEFENFDTLFDKYGACLYGIVLHAVNGDVAIAETLTGHVFARIYRCRDLYNPPRQKLIIWMIAIAAGVIKEHGYTHHLLSVKEKETRLVDHCPVQNLLH